MTAVFRARRRAEEFDAVVAGRLPADRAMDQVAELAGVVTALRRVDPATPSAGFTADLRERLMAEAATALAPAHADLRLPARPRGRRERRLVAAASVVVLVGGTASMAAAAQHALPGEALYPIKRGIEHAQAELATSPAGKGRNLLDQANDRLAEAEGLLAESSSASQPQVPQTIADFTTSAREGADLLLSSFEDSRDPATVVAVRTFAAHGITALQDMARTAPADTQDELAAAATTLSDIDARARDLCGTCATDLPDLSVPAMLLASADVQRALRAARADRLDNSHPVVVDRGAVKDRPAKPAATAAPTPSASPVLPGAGSAPDPDDSPTSLLPKLPSSDGTSSKGTLGDTVDGVTGGLTGVVETLLPDPGTLP